MTESHALAYDESHAQADLSRATDKEEPDR